MLGIIGGSGLCELGLLRDAKTLTIESPYGRASADLLLGHIGDTPCVFLPRHGAGHSVPPHKINYRANIDVLHRAGVTQLISIATVGGVLENLQPGTVLVPDQQIDYTWGRESTFFDGEDGKVEHIDFTWPFDDSVRQQLIQVANTAGLAVQDGGCYGCTQGPRLETAAEIERLKRDGCAVVGMTGAPEAALAREKGLRYAALCLVVNAAAGVAASRQAISIDEIRDVLEAGMQSIQRILQVLAMNAKG